jgi:two-component system, NarL family, sensor kinase
MKVRLIFCLVCLSASLHAQDYYDLDSLRNELRLAKEDTAKVLLLIQLGQQIEGNDPDSALHLYESALHLSEKLQYTMGIIKYYTNATYVYNIKGRYDTSLVLNLQSVEIAKAFANQERLTACLANVGVSYYFLRDFEQAIDYYLQATELAERRKDNNILKVLYANLANAYSDIRQYSQAVEYGEKGLALARVSNNLFSINSALNSLAVVYNAMALPDKAIPLLQEAIQIAREVNNNQLLLNSILNLNNAFLKKGEYTVMKSYCEQAYDLATTLGDQDAIVISLRGLAYYYIGRKSLEEAERYADRSLELAKQHQYVAHESKAYYVKADIALLRNNIREYSRLTIKADSLQEIIFNESIAENIQRLEAQFKSRQQAYQIKQLQQETSIKDLTLRQQRLSIGVLLGVAIALLIIFYLVRKSYKQKKRLLQHENEIQQSRIDQLEKEKQLLATTAIIHGQEQERGRLAKDLHDGLGGLLSGIKFSIGTMKENLVMTPDLQEAFARSMDMLDTSIKELRRVAHNLMPEALIRFGLDTALKDYCHAISQSGALPIVYQSFGLNLLTLSETISVTLYRIVQELINNAVKHASASQALVQLVQQGNTLTITVEDDGKGMDSNSASYLSGMGWNNIRSRVDYLKGLIDIHSDSNKGTTITISIKL